MQKRPYCWQYRELLRRLENLSSHNISRLNPRRFPERKKIYNFFCDLLSKKSKLVDQAELQSLMNEFQEREPGGHYVFNHFNAELLKISLGQAEKEGRTEKVALAISDDKPQVNRNFDYDHQPTEDEKRNAIYMTDQITIRLLVSFPFCR